MQQLAPSPSQQDWPPHGLVSLWEIVFNFDLGSVMHSLELLRLIEKRASEQAILNTASCGAVPEVVPEADVDIFVLTVQGLEPHLRIFKSRQIAALLSEVTNVGLIGKYKTWSQLYQQAAGIRKAILVELGGHHVYVYPEDKFQQFHSYQVDWAASIASFPSTERDIFLGLDCYATGHDTAAVFHMMRVAELGLRSVAVERSVQLKKDKPLSHAQWGEIISEIEKSASAILHGTQAGKAKDDALAFYNGALSHIRALKDKYRNRVMHARECFSEFEAADAIFHTRLFMNGIASKLSEASNGPINWAA